MFFTVILSAVLVMSAYVGWRAGSVPGVSRILPWPARAILLLVLGSAYVLARDAEHAGWPLASRALEVVGAHWIGVLLLLAVAMLAGDLVTGFGLLFRRRLVSIRRGALLAGVGLSLLAFVQGNRPPVVRDHEVRLRDLAPAADGTVIVFVSDLHLGSLLGARWLDARLAQITSLSPDAIVVGGDVLEGDSASERDLLPALGRLSAPRGVWAVAGNHEYHGRGSATLEILGAGGWHVLRNEWREVRPGLLIAGVDGGRERHGPAARGAGSVSLPAALGADDRVARALANRPSGAATILVAHMPTGVEEAARAGVALMLAGHTHDGQIWPFRYLVRTEFRYLAGRYDVEGMPLLVCRGTGTFGPRMRLWYPSEILRVTLRSGGAGLGGRRPGRP